MKVLSLFDGISCGRVALERAGVEVTEYYASEIDKFAIQCAKEIHDEPGCRDGPGRRLGRRQTEEP